MTSTSLSHASTDAKKNIASPSLINAGKLKASSNKSKKIIKSQQDETSAQADSNKSDGSNIPNTDNKNKNNSVTNSKTKVKDSPSSQAKKKANENKNISIFYRPVKRKQPYKPSEVDFHIGVDFESFGKEAPKYTIRGGRQKNSILQGQPPNTPAPGEYDPVLTPSSVSPKPFKHYMSRADSSLHGPILVQTEMSNENNRNIDYIDSEVYQNLRTKGNLNHTIGNVEHAPKFYANEMGTALAVPGCTFIPSRELSLDAVGVKIGNRKPTNYETDNPGPGEYRPESKMSAVLSRSPVYQLSGPQFRFDWLEDKRGNPSPLQYNPQRLEKSSPQYSIGNKSRINKNNRQKKINISEESTRIALLNAESREVVTAPSRYRRNNNSNDSSSNYYLPGEENKKNRPKTRDASSPLSNPSYYNERFNRTQSASRRERENRQKAKSSIATFSYNNYGYDNNYNYDDTPTYSSFYSKCPNVNSNPKNIVPFPIGNYIMKLDVNSITMNEARRYIAKHKDLVAWVEFILDQVMYDKPDNPLLYVREMFLQIKEQDSNEDLPFTDEEFNINQVLVHLREKEKMSGLI